MINRNSVFDSNEKDVRIRATFGMFKLSGFLIIASVPVIALDSTLGMLIPLFVLFALVIGTAAVWGFHSKSMVAADLELKQLQERISNLETIASHDELGGGYAVLKQLKVNQKQ